MVLPRRLGQVMAITASNNAPEPRTVTVAVPADAPGAFVDAVDGRPVPLRDGAATSDAVLLERCLRNLVDNALRYSPDGAQVRVLWQGGPQPRFDIEDAGPGLSAADLARLGDRFFRGAGRAAQGSGLGWSIVRRLAQRHHLAVDVGRSPELGGLRVSLQWPVS